MKAPIREIVLSRTYRQSTRTTPEVCAADLENVLLARMPSRRLQYEQVVDGLFFVAGRLALDEPSLRTGKKGGAGMKGGKKGATDEVAHRAVYSADAVTSKIFDGADPELLTERREASVTGPQMLFFLNSPALWTWRVRWQERPKGGRQPRRQGSPCRRVPSPVLRLPTNAETAAGLGYSEQSVLRLLPRVAVQ